MKSASVGCRFSPQSLHQTGRPPGEEGPLPQAEAGWAGPAEGTWSDTAGPTRPPPEWSDYTLQPPENTHGSVREKTRTRWWLRPGQTYTQVSLSFLECVLVFWSTHPLSDLSDVLPVLPAGKHVGEGERLQARMDQICFGRFLHILFWRKKEQHDMYPTEVSCGFFLLIFELQM